MSSLIMDGTITPNQISNLVLKLLSFKQIDSIDFDTLFGHWKILHAD